MNTAIMAAAGGRKTQYIVDCCSVHDGRRRLVITFATTGQEILRSRLRQACQPADVPEVIGWYSFLISHIVKPYLPDLFPDRRVAGLHFITGQDPTRYKRGVHQYIDGDDLVYSSRLGKLAFDVAKASRGAAVSRLEGIYDEIYVDEVQDLTGNDLEILELLLQSGMKITLVGDARQSIFQTSRSDTKYAKYKSLNKIEWFRLMAQNGLCDIVYRSETWRCNQVIIDFADTIIPNDLGFPATTSHQVDVTGHDGLFAVSWYDAPHYIDTFTPLCLRDEINSKVVADTPAVNFGLAKGVTVDRVLIYPTSPMIDFINRGTPLKSESAAKLYVAATRAQYSVAFVMPDPSACKLPQWTPTGRPSAS